MIKELSIKTGKRNEFIDITGEIQKLVKSIKEGTVIIFCPHTTAGITINENSDPDVTADISKKLNSLIPKDEGYAHSEGNSDSHIKSSLIGPSLTVIIKNGSLILGTWQCIYFCEFDGPRNRKVIVRY